ncbi:MAG: CoA transferase [Candidatus Tectomicrobia bacterium]|nr:CoA transferase [Candidatus Tectomicrobia bacterium]
MTQALQGISVVSLGSSVSAPLCARFLADLGAQVIKVERPGEGDFARGWDEVLPGVSSAHLWCNPNKRSITLNLKSEKGCEALGRLTGRADVFLENFSPGVVGKLGIDYPWARALNPRVIYCHISGYGQDGPYRDMKALDMLIQGEAGAIYLTGPPETPAKVALSIADSSASLFAALSILAALEERRRTGEGQEIDVSMFDCLVSLLGYLPYQYLYGGREPQRVGLRHHLIAPYGPWSARDGKWVNISVATPGAWDTFCRLIGRPDLREDPRFQTNAERVRNLPALDREIDAAFAQEDAPVWIERLKAAGIPCGAVNRIPEVIDHPQTRHRRLLRETDPGEDGGRKERLRLFGFPVQFSRSEIRLAPPPRLGEHTQMILAELGYSAEEMEVFRREGVV